MIAYVDLSAELSPRCTGIGGKFGVLKNGKRSSMIQYLQALITEVIGLPQLIFR